MNVTNAISINLWGIVNPNRIDNTRTGSFGIGLVDQFNNIIEGNFNLQGIIPLLAPG